MSEGRRNDLASVSTFLLHFWQVFSQCFFPESHLENTMVLSSSWTSRSGVYSSKAFCNLEVAELLLLCCPSTSD